MTASAASANISNGGGPHESTTTAASARTTSERLSDKLQASESMRCSDHGFAAKAHLAVAVAGRGRKPCEVAKENATGEPSHLDPMHF